MAGGVLKRAIAKRADGERPSPLAAAAAAFVAGLAVAALTYRVLRS